MISTTILAIRGKGVKTVDSSVLDGRANVTIARNMQSAAFNLLYAGSIPALSSSLQAITAGATSASSLSTTQQNDVRGLLTANETYDFGSGAWFLTSQCTESVRSGLQNGSQEGWEEYITGCIGTTVTSDRMAYWQRAMQAFGASA